MNKKRDIQYQPVLADMHTDGLRFDPKAKEVLKLKDNLRNAKAIRDSQNS